MLELPCAGIRFPSNDIRLPNEVPSLLSLSSQEDKRENTPGLGSAQAPLKPPPGEAEPQIEYLRT
ncbi:hypothetical protein M422DRAFT_261406 [Sphaerobolus stellatus SS14]|uniref:Uncharacterized protein n=1 Tax=Sphaerobolus stellatus (strain SS14) TaxID=990650 RepID=A0A0C9VF60_SPHS4|nr:hypothetical protein M422DRAFT_261406 [Sphaerobolus stellatus SS14]